MPQQSKKKPVITRKQGTGGNHGVGCSSATIPVKVEYLDTPIKSEIDRNEYRLIKLPNGLKALLVNHPILSTKKDDSKAKSKSANNSDRTNTDIKYEDLIQNEKLAGRAGCSLSINVGSFSDSPTVPCISHILKSVILTASKKYPLVNGFREFVTKSDGAVLINENHDKTKFYFWVAEQNFSDALDRFANCFIEPLLRKDIIDYTRRRIEKANLSTVQFSNYNNAKTYLFSKIASGYDQHPACHLGPNHVKILRDQSDERVYEEVVKFMKRHYSANRMAVVIDGHAPLDTLEQYAKTYFSGILDNKLPPPDFTRFSYDRCFDIKEFQMMYQMKPPISENGDYHLELNWPMPPERKFYRCKPHNYIAFAINHTGKGSLGSYLKMKNWCVRLECGASRSDFENSVYSLFSIFISLTQEGYKNRKQVLDVVYSYINFLRREGPQHRIWESFRKDTNTEYRLALVPLFSVSCAPLSDCMLECMRRDYLTASYVCLEYNPVAIKQCLNLLSSEKANIIVYDKKFAKSDSVGEEWKEEDNDPVHYRRMTISKEWIEYWNTVEPLPEFQLPDVRSEVEEDFEIIPPPENPSEYPKKIHADEVSEIYYKLDTKFRIPTTYINHCYCSSLPLVSPENAVMVDVFGKIVNDLATEILDSVVDAGSSCQINGTEKGILVQVAAISAKGAFFMTMVADIASNVWKQVTKKLYASMMKKKMKDYESRAFEPADLADEVRLGIVRTVRWTALDKLTACSKLDFAKFKDFARHFTDSIFLKCLVQGNMRKADVVANVKECIHKLKCKPRIPNGTNFPTPIVIHKIPEGEHCYRFYVPRKNTLCRDAVTVTNYYQFPAKSFRQTVLNELLIRFMVHPDFSIFRALERVDNIGVIPGINTFGRHGYSLCINVMTFGGFTDAPMAEAFIEKYRKALHLVFKNMSDKDWTKARKVFTDLKKPLFSNLENEVNWNWMEIGAQAYVFHRDVAELAALEGLTITELRNGMMNLTSSVSHIRKLTVQCVGMREAAQNLVCTTQNANSQELLKTLCGTPRERAEKPSDYFITDIDKFKSELPTFRISGEITPRTDRN